MAIDAFTHAATGVVRHQRGIDPRLQYRRAQPDLPLMFMVCCALITVGLGEVNAQPVGGLAELDAGSDSHSQHGRSLLSELGPDVPPDLEAQWTLFRLALREQSDKLDGIQVCVLCWLCVHGDCML